MTNGCVTIGFEYYGTPNASALVGLSLENYTSFVYIFGS